MPVIAFTTKKDFESWIKKFVKPTKNLLFAVTETSEVIVQPTVSTKPRMVGYIKVQNGVVEYVKKLSKLFEIEYFTVSRYGWDTDRHPSIKYKYEQE